MTIDTDKALLELEILRGFIDFVNNQVGVYMDCLSGFEGNRVRIQRQVARVQRPTGRRTENGRPVMVYASVEDPSLPDVIHHRIIRAEDFIATNAQASFNEQQVCCSIIVFLFAYWDEEIRPQIACVRRVEASEIKVDAMGDLRIARNSIIHNKGIITDTDHTKLRKMTELFKPGQKIALSHDEMHKLFVLVKQAIAEIIMVYVGHLPGAPDPSDIVSIAIQRGGRPSK